MSLCLVDRLSIETFGNQGEISITNVAQQKPGAPSLVLRVPDGEAVLTALTVHELQSIWKGVSR
jgi:sucrose-6-phosphate hydrolase SacC (GH32 family)